MSNGEHRVHALDIWVTNPGGVDCRRTRRSSEWKHVDFSEINRTLEGKTAEELLMDLFHLPPSESPS